MTYSTNALKDRRLCGVTHHKHLYTVSALNSPCTPPCNNIVNLTPWNQPNWIQIRPHDFETVQQWSAIKAVCINGINLRYAPFKNLHQPQTMSEVFFQPHGDTFIFLCCFWRTQFPNERHLLDNEAPLFSVMTVSDFNNESNLVLLFCFSSVLPSSHLLIFLSICF